MSYQIRDPLLVALWGYTGGGNNRLIWSNELNRREGAAAAVYLLMKHDGQKAAHACKVVAKVTGENAETLRGRFKGKAVADYEKSPDGALTFQAIENMHRAGFGAEADWRGLNGIFVQAASSLTPDISGYPIQSPYVAIANRQAEIMMPIAPEFGFTPASRSRIATPWPAEPTLFDNVGDGTNSGASEGPLESA